MSPITDSLDRATESLRNAADYLKRTTAAQFPEAVADAFDAAAECFEEVSNQLGVCIGDDEASSINARLDALESTLSE